MKRSLIAAVIGILIGYAVTTFAQPARLKWWTVQRLSMGADLDVYDFSGVCLYVISGNAYIGAIAAVPKTQLPVGTGCQ